MLLARPAVYFLYNDNPVLTNVKGQFFDQCFDRGRA